VLGGLPHIFLPKCVQSWQTPICRRAPLVARVDSTWCRARRIAVRSVVSSEAMMRVYLLMKPRRHIPKRSYVVKAALRSSTENQKGLRLELFRRGRIVLTRTGLFQCWGEAPMGTTPTPPVARRVSEIRAASVQLPRAGAVSLWRCSLGRGHFYHPAKCYYAIRPWEIPRPECTLKTPSTQGGETCLCSSRMHRIPIPA
jgi:hypothetical protein